MARSAGELMGLEVEAERLVRAGESRAEVSRRLGVSVQTLAGWALRGGWRKKDLEFERHQEIARETILAIRHGNKQVDARQAARAPLEGFMREAVRLLAAGDDGSLQELSKMVGGIENQKKLEAPKVTLSPDTTLGKMSMGDLDVDDVEPMLDEDGNEWTPERIREHQRGAYARGRRGRNAKGEEF